MNPQILAAPGGLTAALDQVINLLKRVPDSLIAFVGRFSIAAVFWLSGQTKVQGFAINLVNGEFALGWPRLSDSLVDLFREEYRLPLVPPELAAPMAAFAEHFFPLLILLGLATRFSALALLGMTLTIQFFVYPDAWWSEHALWSALALVLAVRGAGLFSLDALLLRLRAK